jgi:hypothetical protein
MTWLRTLVNVQFLWIQTDRKKLVQKQLSFRHRELNPELPPTAGDELSKEGGGVPYTMSDLRPGREQF